MHPARVKKNRNQILSTGVCRTIGHTERERERGSACCILLSIFHFLVGGISQSEPFGWSGFHWAPEVERRHEGDDERSSSILRLDPLEEP